MINKLKVKTYQFLKWMERWTKTDMIYLAHGSFWLSLIQFISIASGFLTSLAFANLLPIETYGQYKYILSIVSLLSIPTLGQMSIAIIQSVANGYEGTLSLAIKTKIKWGILGGLASILLAGYYYFNGNNQLTLIFLIISPLIPLSGSFALYNSFLKGKKKFKISTKYSIITNTLSILTLIITIFFTDNIILILLSFFLPKNIINFILYKVVIKKYVSNKKIDIEAVNYGKYLSFTGIIGVISSNIDRILLWHYLGPTQIAIHAIANAPIKQLNSTINNNITELAFPKLSKTPLTLLKKSLPLKLLKYIIITFFIAIVYYYLIPFFYKLLYPQYIESIKYSQMMALTPLFLPANILYQLVLAKKDKVNILKIKIFIPIITILGMFLLIPKFGITGLIINIYISGTVRFIYLIYLIFKNEKIFSKLCHS